MPFADAAVAVAWTQRSAWYRSISVLSPATVVLAIGVLVPGAHAHALHAQTVAAGIESQTLCGFRVEWPRQSSISRDDPASECRPLSSRAAMRQSGDRWLAADKLRHFFASYGITTLGFGSARLAGIDQDTALPLSVAGAIVAGIGKEMVDVRRGGPFSFRDLVYNAAGIAVAVGILRNAR